MTLAQDGKWQLDDVALLDLENGFANGSSDADSGISVSIDAALAPERESRMIEGVKQFRNAEGTLINLQTAYLTLWSVKLESDCSDSRFANLAPRWLDWLVAPALAHADPAPDTLSTPNVIKLAAADSGTSLRMGSIGPAPAHYCGVTLDLLKADADALHLPQDINMVGRSVYSAASWQSSEAAEAIDFVIDSASALLPAKAILSQPLLLNSDNRSANIALNLHYQRWFDAIDFTQIGSEATLMQLLSNISHSITASAVP